MSDATKISKHLQEIACEIDDRLESLVGHKVGFSLFVWTDTRSNYISNAAREEVIKVLEEHLSGWKQGMPDIPAHKII